MTHTLNTQSNVKGPNDSNAGTGSVFGSLYGKIHTHPYLEKSLSSCLSFRLRHISAWKTASVPGSRARQLLQLNCCDLVTQFTAKNFTSPCLCLPPLLCCCSYCLWKLVLKSSDRDFSELSPRKQPPLIFWNNID